jgi:hypothetical protein
MNTHTRAVRTLDLAFADHPYAAKSPNPRTQSTAWTVYAFGATLTASVKRGSPRIYWAVSGGPADELLIRGDFEPTTPDEVRRVLGQLLRLHQSPTRYVYEDYPSVDLDRLVAGLRAAANPVDAVYPDGDPGDFVGWLVDAPPKPYPGPVVCVFQGGAEEKTGRWGGVPSRVEITPLPSGFVDVEVSGEVAGPSGVEGWGELWFEDQSADVEHLFLFLRDPSTW